ncbi:MAG: hypothetical protein DRI90_07800 [Deltaproteobacteria bacterium]|nr:MAG: hypothetical protein DRI90_07800 [Deltaproteobacteria bacterium]
MSDQPQKKPRRSASGEEEGAEQRRRPSHHSDVVTSWPTPEPTSGELASEEKGSVSQTSSTAPTTEPSSAPEGASDSSGPGADRASGAEGLVAASKPDTEAPITSTKESAELADTMQTIVDSMSAPRLKGGCSAPSESSAPKASVSAESRATDTTRSGEDEPPSPSGPEAPQSTPSKGDEDLSRTLNAVSDSYNSSIGFEPTPPPADADKAGADPLIGLVVADRYRILERIGRGGMGIVYRVEHVRIAKLLAMKLLAGELSTNKEVVRRFKQEALTVSKLSSPHTVQVFDYGVWNHLTYLIMEVVEGYDLAQPLRTEGPMPFARLGKLMVQVCSSLAEAHSKGIVHRDVKPENVMIVDDSHGVESAKVVDFGLAKLRENPDLNEVTLQGAVIGTPYYMSPEQVTGEEVDGRTDIYSLGAVMFRAITGTQAFQAATPMGMFTKHLTAPVPSAKARRKKLDIPDGVSDLIEVCMAKDPDDRIQTVEELRDLLIVELTALGLPSSDQLVISGERPSLAGRTAAGAKRAQEKKRADQTSTDLGMTQVATRQELESYERKLRRTRYGAWALFGAVLLGGGGSAVYALRATHTGYGALEKERNDSGADANPLRLGHPVKGHIGQRLDSDKGDRDFYAFDVPGVGEAVTHIALRLTALPNFPTCSILYRVGFQQPLAQYCTGRASQDLEVSALSLDPGAYFVAVVQDLNPYGTGRVPFVLENVTDSYELLVALASPAEGEEIEPNDVPESAQKLPTSGVMSGTLAWIGDEDVYCVDPDHAGPIVWQVDDGPRAQGTVLEVTPLLAGLPGPVVRVHAAGTKPFGRPRLESDVNGPWSSPPIDDGCGDRCLRLRLTTDPWVERLQQGLPPAGPTEYQISLTEPAPK